MGHSDKIFALSSLIIASFAMRQFLVFIGQQWISTFAHTATLMTIPVITYVITSVISGNIALSLGMVGVLSIVRFRNPVKSPFELSTYFMCITMRITASVNLIWLVLLCAAVSAVILIIFILNSVCLMIRKKPWINYSFVEGN